MQQRNDRGWAVFERDMNTGGFREISALLQQGVDITSPYPLGATLRYGHHETRVWHVFRRSGGEEWNKFRSIYSGPSETEARWDYVNSGKDAEIVLTSPLNQEVDHRVDKNTPGSGLGVDLR